MYFKMIESTIMLSGRMINRGRSDAAFSSSLPLKNEVNLSNKISKNKNCIVTIQNAVFHGECNCEGTEQLHYIKESSKSYQ